MKTLYWGAVAACLISLTGCETTSAVYGSSQKGFAGLSCNEIYNAFSAYERDKQTANAATDLSAALGMPYTGGNAEAYYNTAKTTANITLLAQGCNPL